MIICVFYRRYSFDEFCVARRSHIVKGFIDALTKGGPGGVPKPIELLSHDPLRYIGDMLAWIHQVFASEKELTLNLLRICSDEGWVFLYSSSSSTASLYF